jgi:hypothetical protein
VNIYDGADEQEYPTSEAVKTWVKDFDSGRISELVVA